MAQISSKSKVRLRPLALPVEHGGWSFLGAPIILGLWVAPSVAGLWLSLAALGAFLTRQPLRLAVADLRRGRRYPRTPWALGFAALYGLTALGGFAAAWLTSAHPFWPPLLLAAPLAAIQFGYEVRRQGRTLPAELSGVAALSGLVAALVMAGGWAFGPALLLWGLVALQATTAISYVAVRLRLARGEPARRWTPIVAHIIAVLIVVGLALINLSGWLRVGAFVLMLGRAWWGLRPQSLSTRAPLVGMQELGFSVLTVASLALGGVG